MLDDVVADTVLVVKDLLICRCIKHSFDIILIHQNTNKHCKMRLSGHHILHLRSTLPHVCHYPTDLVLDEVVTDTVLVVKDLLMGRCIKHSFDIILIHQNTNKQCSVPAVVQSCAFHLMFYSNLAAKTNRNGDTCKTSKH